MTGILLWPAVVAVITAGSGIRTNGSTMTACVRRCGSAAQPTRVHVALRDASL